MPDPVSFAELEAQHGELLAARTVLSTFTPLGATQSDSDSGQNLVNTARFLLGLSSQSNGADGTNYGSGSGASKS